MPLLYGCVIGKCKYYTALSLKIKNSQDANFAVTCGTVGCHNDILRFHHAVTTMLASKQRSVFSEFFQNKTMLSIGRRTVRLRRITVIRPWQSTATRIRTVRRGEVVPTLSKNSIHGGALICSAPVVWRQSRYLIVWISVSKEIVIRQMQFIDAGYQNWKVREIHIESIISIYKFQYMYSYKVSNGPNQHGYSLNNLRHVWYVSHKPKLVHALRLEHGYG